MNKNKSQSLKILTPEREIRKFQIRERAWTEWEGKEGAGRCVSTTFTIVPLHHAKTVHGPPAAVKHELGLVLGFHCIYSNASIITPPEHNAHTQTQTHGQTEATHAHHLAFSETLTSLSFSKCH